MYSEKTQKPSVLVEYLNLEYLWCILLPRRLVGYDGLPASQRLAIRSATSTTSCMGV